ncbi:LIM and calponin homology domains-containing protein 1 [Gavia stellata]|uniref:LIM and calponin homology domains-containing protein 1 n=1 Tax=Gavia stellata TaxID=37040 RepID=UPI0028964D0A|nr:LIM and calponin homology domains-containing protein 1 [Gavia stellata]
MRKETEDIESPKRSIRDSGYIDCWDSERSDSLSPPRHGRDDSFDSLDSFGSRSQQTPSPDVVLRGSSDGRGSDSETDLPHRKMPDVKKDDMLARRTSHGEPKSAVPFNQYLPNKSNQTFYVPAPLRKKKAEREEYRKSWSTATSPLGDRPFSKPHPETIEEEQNETSGLCEKEKVGSMAPEASSLKNQVGLNQNKGNSIDQSPSCSAKETSAPKRKDAEEIRKLRRLEEAGIKVMSAAQRYGSKKPTCEDNGSTPDIILRRDNPFMTHYQGKDSGSEDEAASRVPDLEKDDFATRRARMNQPKHIVPFNSFSIGPYTSKDKGKLEDVKKPLQMEKQEHARRRRVHMASARQIVTSKENPLLQTEKTESEEEQQVKVPDTERDDLAKRQSQSTLPQLQEDVIFVNASITKADLETGKRLKLSGEPSEEDFKCPSDTLPPAEITVKAAAHDDFAVRKARANKKAGSPKQKFVHFGPVTEIDQQRWDKLIIGRASSKSGTEEESKKDGVENHSGVESCPSATVGSLGFAERSGEVSKPQNESSEVAKSGTDDSCRRMLSPVPAFGIISGKQTLCSLNKRQESTEEDCIGHLPDIERDDMLVRRMGTFQRRTTSPVPIHCPPLSVAPHLLQQQQGEAVAREKDLKTPREAESTVTREESQEQLEIPLQQSGGTENKVKFPDPQRDDMLARRTGAFLKQPEPSVKQFLPMPFSKQQNKQGKAGEVEKKATRPEKCPQVCINSSGKPIAQPPPEEQQGQEECNLPPAGQDETICTAQVGEGSLNEVHLGQTSKLQEVPEENKMETLSSKDERLQTFGPRTAVSDDAESMSMFDMRCEEEAVTQPHSKARHEKLQNVHNQLKEDETRWQDDLARWKSRRRSASQDLIKKEAERKKMERLLSGDGTNERRKSIKTYREIVEEKERRERELHEAYKNAKSQEEAESILQQYIERFTISEAVLERLQMPKILERSHSVEPNSPLKDPNPLRYLRQQSLPAPKFTATIEATIVPTAELEPSGSTGRTSPSKSVVSKAVPMLTPKPYSQPKNTQEVLKNFKVDGKVSMNGENFNSMEEKDKECTTVILTPSPSRPLKFDGVARGDRPLLELKKDPTSVELSLQRPATHSVREEPTASPVEADAAASQQVEASPGSAGPASPACPSPGSDQKQFKSTAACASPVVKRLEFLPSPVPSEEAASSEKDVKKPEMKQQKEAELRATPEVMKPKALEQEGSVVLPFLKKLPETSQVTLQNSGLQEPPRGAAVPLRVRNNWRRSQFFSQSADSDSGDKSNRFNFWSWDPEEERKRQERWQHEQERLLQEKYQKEQDKLKEEWEKAQREVEEEERRYYEEERKIIEDTVVPFIVSSNSAELLSSSSSTTEGNKTANTTDSNSSPEEGKQKEVTRQKKLLWEQDSMPSLKSKENELWQEKRSGNKVLPGPPETGILKGGEQEHQVLVMEHSSPARLNLPLTQDVSWNQQLLTKQSPRRTEDIRQRPFPGQSAGQQPSSAGETRRAGYLENFRSGPSSPCSPAAPSQSPNRYKRSVSGKKLCSTCGLPLGKGAAMIIETLGLYFHIQCFRCGICKGQLGDAASGTDVRIRNGLLNCNDCYIRSRTAGQPTTL